jgi:cytosine/adenosine deaminase-related metal-dependent hydrolase
MTRTLLTGATIISMDDGRPEFELADVLVEDDEIAAIGADLDGADCERVDLAGRIVIPGLINAHLHCWQTAIRAAAADTTLRSYLAGVHGGVARLYQPSDMYTSALGAALSQIESGTTTVIDWAHNCRSAEHADANVDGLAAGGIRAVFLHGTPHKSPRRTHSLSEIDRLARGPIATNALLTLGMAIGGPQLSQPAVAIADVRAANERGLVVSTHQSAGGADTGWRELLEAGVVGPRTNVVHGNDLSEPTLKRLIDAGATITATPEIELSHGHGFPLVGAVLGLGSAPSLGTDTDAVIAGDMLTAARFALATQRGADHLARRSADRFPADTTIAGRQALAWATTEGARAAGLSDRVGRLRPGMQADVAVIDTRRLSLWSAHDPVATALRAGAGDIEAVMIAGRWRKRDHRLLDVDETALRNQLAESGDRLIRPLSAPGRVAGLRRRVTDKVVGTMLERRAED